MQIKWLPYLLFTIQAFCAETIKSEFIADPAPTFHSHASTLVQLSNGDLLSAWVGGSAERAHDTAIWLCRYHHNHWQTPQKIAHAEETASWNPVLFQMPNDEILLFYKVGPNPQSWTTRCTRSEDQGKHWSTPETLPAGITGPVRNKPALLNTTTLICGSSIEAYRANACYIDRSHDAGKTWEKYGPIHIDTQHAGLIQPTVVIDKDNTLYMFCRSRSHPQAIHRSLSKDGGKTWTPPKPLKLPNPDSAIDTLLASNGNLYLVYNHSTNRRTPLYLAVSKDGGKNFETALELENETGEFYYPAIIEGLDGNLHITYSWNRQFIKHVIVQP